jgi:hypothetical protein
MTPYVLESGRVFCGGGSNTLTIAPEEGPMKRRVTALLAVAFTWAAVGQGLTTAWADDVPRMTKEELRARLGAPELVILDLRIGRDWQASDLKITGAVREDPGDVAGWVEKYPKEKTIVTYCA